MPYNYTIGGQLPYSSGFKQHRDLSNKNSLHETLYALLFLTSVRQILMPQPDLAYKDLSGHVHLATAVMRNNQMPISAHAFIVLIVDLKQQLNRSQATGQ